MTTPAPTLRTPHSRAGLASLLLFQLVIVTFGVLMVIATRGLAPGWLGTGREALPRALHDGFLITLPAAVLGLVLGLIGTLQLRRRKLLGLLGAMLNGLHALLGLTVLSWM